MTSAPLFTMILDTVELGCGETVDWEGGGGGPEKAPQAILNPHLFRHATLTICQ